jgi:hypothetical protein
MFSAAQRAAQASLKNETNEMNEKILARGRTPWVKF